MIFKPEGLSNDFLIKGIYFESTNDVSTDYFIHLSESKECTTTVKIYSIEHPCNFLDSEGLKCGDVIFVPDYIDKDLLCEIELWSKHFFLNFQNNMQMYYDNKKYGDWKCNTNSVSSLMECIDYAIEFGLIQYQIELI